MSDTPSDVPPVETTEPVAPPVEPVEPVGPPVEPVETTGPVLRVVKGAPSAEELAALVAVVASLGGPAAPATRRTPDWNAPPRLQRQVQRHGPGAWRASGLPH